MANEEEGLVPERRQGASQLDPGEPGVVEKMDLRDLVPGPEVHFDLRVVLDDRLFPCLLSHLDGTHAGDDFLFALERGAGRRDAGAPGNLAFRLLEVQRDP